jgi:membrane protein DedA with SNARE-associated domain
LADLGTLLNGLAQNYGYVGVFLASLLGSVVPFLPVPYLIVVVVLSSRLDPLSLGVAAGIGGALGKATSYFLGRAGYLASGAGTRRNLEFLGRFVGKYGDLGVFVFAVTPLPDDIYLVPLGMLKYPFWRFMAVNTAGKVLLSVAIAYLGRSYYAAASFYLGTSQFVATVAVVVATVLITVLLIRADWPEAYDAFKRGGARAVIEDLGGIFHLRRRSREVGRAD